ncbi:MAG: hypothetical protein WCO27_04055 [Actinomycetes bacterium]|jgi:hypothetical protein
MMIRKLWKILGDEEGSVESALVLIPLLALFLITFQLIVGINYRNLDLSYAQSSASSHAINSIVESDDELVILDGENPQNTLSLLISHSVRRIPSLIPRIPFLKGGGDMHTDIDAIAVMESFS